MMKTAFKRYADLVKRYVPGMIQWTRKTPSMMIVMMYSGIHRVSKGIRVQSYTALFHVSAVKIFFKKLRPNFTE